MHACKSPLAVYNMVEPGCGVSNKEKQIASEPRKRERKSVNLVYRETHFFNTSKYATNYIISFEVYDGFIGQKILKL